MAAAAIRRLLRPASSSALSTARRFHSSIASPTRPPPPPPRVSFDWSDDDDEGSDPNLPSPYNPFRKNPDVYAYPDPTDLKEIFLHLRCGGLNKYAVKMFDGLCKEGLRHEALAFYSEITHWGDVPDVVTLTAILNAYADAGPAHWRDAVRTYGRRLSNGVTPNAHTLAVLVKGLAACDRYAEAGEYLVEMLDRGMRPNVETCLAAFAAHVRMEKVEEGKALLETMKKKGFTLDEEAVRSGTVKRGHMFRAVMNLLFGK